MSEDSRVEQALAAYLEFREMGGPEPDISHLTEDEKRELQELIDVLDRTEGVAFGAGGFGDGKDETDSSGARIGRLPSSALGQRLVGRLRDEIPAAARIALDQSSLMASIGGTNIAERWIVGTFGGRVRVWLLDVESIDAQTGEAWMSDIAHAFRLLPDTVAIALVSRDLECLLVQPEDCAPRIEVPSGMLTSRRYRRPIQDVDVAVSGFLRDLIPYWEPVSGLVDGNALSIEVGPLAAGQARGAVAEQVGIGARARKTNPKRSALEALGDREIDSLAGLALKIYEGVETPARVTELLLGLAKTS